MGRYSPTVVPRAPGPLDFGGISDALRGVRDDRERAEERERQRRAEERQTEQDIRVAATTPGVRMRPTVAEPSAPMRSRAGVAEVEDVPMPRPAQEPAVGPALRSQMQKVRVQFDKPTVEPVTTSEASSQDWVDFNAGGKPFQYSASLAARLKGQAEAQALRAKRDAEYEGAVQAGASPDEARLYAYGSGSMTYDQRLGLEGVRANGQMQLQGLRNQGAMDRTKLQVETMRERDQRRDALTQAMLGIRRAEADYKRGRMKHEDYIAALEDYRISEQMYRDADMNLRSTMGMMPKDPLEQQMMPPEKLAELETLAASARAAVEAARKERDTAAGRVRSTRPYSGAVAPPSATPGGDGKAKGDPDLRAKAQAWMQQNPRQANETKEQYAARMRSAFTGTK